QLTGVSMEYFVTTVFYDALNRPQRTIDNLGQTAYTRYDSRDNLVAAADAEGPISDEIIQRRAFAGGAGTIDTINNPGNVIRHQYDGLNRAVLSERVLTGTGMGDGVNIGADIFGVSSTLPTPDPTQ